LRLRFGRIDRQGCRLLRFERSSVGASSAARGSNL
jgi:hypothetical protein